MFSTSFYWINTELTLVRKICIFLGELVQICKLKVILKYNKIFIIKIAEI